MALTNLLGGSIHIWDAANAKELILIPGHREGSIVVAFSADGKSVYTATGEHGHTSTPPDEWPELVATAVGRGKWQGVAR